MGTRLSSPGPQRRRFAAYIEGLANAAGHADRHAPLKNYCTGLLLSGDRKSVEPMAARLAPDNVRRMHQSLHHLVADAPWNDEEVLGQVRQQVLPAMQKNGPVVAWIVDDTGFPKQGKHSVGVARQYCGQIGKHDNSQAAVSLSVSTWNASLPIAWRLYLPEVWCQDPERRQKAGIPEGIEFQTKPAMALEQMRQAIVQKGPGGSGPGGCSLWERYAIPCRRQRTGIAIRGSYRVVHNHLGARAATLTGPAAKARSWCATQTTAAQRRPSACFGEAD